MGNKYGGFPGGGFGNMQNILKQAQKMQADMEKKQAELANKEIETSAGGGAVVVKATGDKVIKEIKNEYHRSMRIYIIKCNHLITYYLVYNNKYRKVKKKT